MTHLPRPKVEEEWQYVYICANAIVIIDYTIISICNERQCTREISQKRRHKELFV